MDGLAQHESDLGVPLTLLAFEYEDRGLLFEVSAPEILGTFTWRGVQALAGSALETLCRRTSRDGSFWFEPLEARNPAGHLDIVLRLWFVLDEGVPNEIDQAAVRRCMKRAEARIVSRSTEPISDKAHPSLVLYKGEMHQAWLVDPPDVVAPFLLWNDQADELEILGARRGYLDEADLISCSRNALLICSDDSVLRT